MNTVSILIVEDEKALAMTLEDALLQASADEFAVEVVYSAIEAQKLLRTRRFSLVISDLRLPGMSGLELIKEIRTLYPETRTILMTGYGSEAVEAAARSLTDAYLTKPFKLPEVLKLIQNILDGPNGSKRPHALIVDESLTEIKRCLDQLLVAVQAPYALVLDFGGSTMVASGNPHVVDKAALNALLVSGMAASNELAAALKEKHAFDMHYYDGERYEIFLRKIDESMVLALLIDLLMTNERTGSIRLSLKRAVGVIQELAPQMKAAQKASSHLPHVSPEQMDDAIDSALFGLEDDFLIPAPSVPAAPRPAPAPPAPLLTPAAKRPARPATGPLSGLPTDPSEIITLEEAIRRGIIRGNLSE